MARTDHSTGTRDARQASSRRQALVVGLLLASGVAGLPCPAGAAPDDAAWNALRQNGSVVLFRHASAPGGGDPAGMTLDDCASQRNLDASGRAQAKRIGDTFRAQKVTVGEVVSSQWCRTRDTGDLAFPGQRRDEPVFNSFFGESGRESRQTAEAVARIDAWKGPGALVVVTHQVNITALTGVFPVSGEGVVVRANTRGGLDVVGRVQP